MSGKVLLKIPRHVFNFFGKIQNSVLSFDSNWSSRELTIGEDLGQEKLSVFELETETCEDSFYFILMFLDITFAFGKHPLSFSCQYKENMK